LTRFFWRYFFRLLLLFVAGAEWACFAWLAYAAGLGSVPFEAHLLAPILIYALNRLVVARPIPPPGRWRTLRRAYTGIAFTSLFGSFVLLFVGVFWLAVRAAFAFFEAMGADMPVAALAHTARVLATGGVLGVAAVMARGYGAGQRRVWINHFDVEMARLDPRFDGLRIVQISDIHLGQYMDEHAIARHVERVNALSPDVIFITGDVTDGLDHAPRTFPVLGELHAPLGVFVILGNHDVYTGADGVERALGRWTRFAVLRDRTASIEREGAHIHIIGLDDRGMDWARGVPHCLELDRLFTSLPPDAPVVLLSHRPDLFPQAARLGIQLVLAGHTDGGQFAIPWTKGRVATLAHFMTRYPRGTYRRQRSILHVNLGLGVTGQPVRVASPREITCLTLRSREDEA
jgi:predicted MPP superfamily phosphohydrolase